MKLCNVIVSQNHVNQLSTLSQNWLKAFDLHTSSQMCVLLVNCRESSLSFSRTELSHTEPATLYGFWSTYQHSSTSWSTQWSTLSVAPPNTMSTTPVCSQCQWTEAAPVKSRYAIEQSKPIIDRAINEWCMSLQACLPQKRKLWARCNINNWLKQQYYPFITCKNL